MFSQKYFAALLALHVSDAVKGDLKPILTVPADFSCIDGHYVSVTVKKGYVYSGQLTGLAKKAAANQCKVGILTYNLKDIDLSKSFDYTVACTPGNMLTFRLNSLASRVLGIFKNQVSGVVKSLTKDSCLIVEETGTQKSYKITEIAEMMSVETPDNAETKLLNQIASIDESVSLLAAEIASLTEKFAAAKDPSALEQISDDFVQVARKSSSFDALKTCLQGHSFTMRCENDLTLKDSYLRDVKLSKNKPLHVSEGNPASGTTCSIVALDKSNYFPSASHKAMFSRLDNRPVISILGEVDFVTNGCALLESEDEQILNDADDNFKKWLQAMPEDDTTAHIRAGRDQTLSVYAAAVNTGRDLDFASAAIKCVGKVKIECKDPTRVVAGVADWSSGFNCHLTGQAVAIDLRADSCTVKAATDDEVAAVQEASLLPAASGEDAALVALQAQLADYCENGWGRSVKIVCEGEVVKQGIIAGGGSLKKCRVGTESVDLSKCAVVPYETSSADESSSDAGNGEARGESVDSSSLAQEAVSKLGDDEPIAVAPSGQVVAPACTTGSRLICPINGKQEEVVAASLHRTECWVWSKDLNDRFKVDVSNCKAAGLATEGEDDSVTGGSVLRDASERDLAAESATADALECKSGQRFTCSLRGDGVVVRVANTGSCMVHFDGSTLREEKFNIKDPANQCRPL